MEALKITHTNVHVPVGPMVRGGKNTAVPSVWPHIV